jgi:hypothetical protein
MDGRCTLKPAERVSPDDKIRVFVRAADARPAELGGPGVGESPKLDFTVVSISDLRDELIRRQRLSAERFAEAQNLQTTAYAKTDAAGASPSAGAGVLSPAAREGIVDSARAQRTVGDECVRARELFEAVRQEMAYNGIGDASERTAMRVGIIEPLARLSKRCADVASSLSSLPGAEGGGDLSERLVELAGEQKAILEEMRAISRRMEKLRNLQAMADKVQRMVRWLEELQREIEEHRDAGIGDVFQPTSRPATPP